MNTDKTTYKGCRYPPEIISYAVWLYHRFCLSFGDVEDLLAERGIIVSYEAIRQWCKKFGPSYARAMKRRQGVGGDTWFLDEVFVTIQGRRQYLWRAVDQDGDTLDILVQKRRDRRAAEVSHESTRQREYQMRRFKSPGHAQRFLSVHAIVGNLFRLGRHLIRASHYRMFRARAFAQWRVATYVS